MFDEFLLCAQEIFRCAQREGRLARNPDDDQLRAMTLEEPEVRETRYGNLVANSEPTSRATMKTANNVDEAFAERERQLLQDAKQRLGKESLVSIDVEVGDGSEGITARLIVPRRYAHVAYGGRKLFKATTTEEPTYYVVMFCDEAFAKNPSRLLPSKDITIRLAYASDGRMVKIIRNSSYSGEWKKAVFAGEDYRCKLKGNGIFLHSGCRKDTLETSHGPYATMYSLFVALSGNGKTSTSCRVLARKGRERSWLIQNDGGILGRDGTFRGYEAGGFFFKTNGLSPEDYREGYYGCLKPKTFLENVSICDDGSLDLFNLELTANGRAIVERRDFMHAGRHINTESVDNLFIITRGNIIPAIARLTHEQAAAFMVLGQSMETSAGDPTQSGKIKQEFFYDPFIAGDRAEHANLFYDILKTNAHINCYLLNTGWVGEGETYRDIDLSDTVGILDSLLRGGLEDWILSERSKMLIPRAVRTVDSILMHPEKLFTYAEFDRQQRALDLQRAEAMDRYPGLDRKIRAVFQK